MAEVLVRNRADDDPKGFPRGGVVCVRPDKHAGWGKKETPENGFVVLRFPGVPVEEMQKYVGPDSILMPSPVTGEDVRVVLKESRFAFDLEAIPREAKEHLDAGGFAVVVGATKEEATALAVDSRVK